MLKPHKAGRPRTLGKGALSYTVKLRQDQLKAIGRFSGHAGGRGPETLRQLLDLGIKAARSRIAR
jgi:hypothetical protein